MVQKIKNLFLDKMDAILKKINSDRNTFFGFILTLICAFLCIDRIIEILFIITIGIASSYWNFLQYTISFCLIIFTYFVMIESKYVTHKLFKKNIFMLFASMFACLGLCYVVENTNKLGWRFIFLAPHYLRVLEEDFHLIKPAFTALGLGLTIIVSQHIYVWFKYFISKDSDILGSILDANGLKLNSNISVPKMYTLYNTFGKDTLTGNEYSISEEGRFNHLMVIGPHNKGKTTLVLEPMIANDIAKKRFFIEAKKELGYSLLKSNIAYLNKPFTNSHLNSEFNLNMLSPKKGQENTFNSYLNKIRLNNKEYKDLGATAIFSNISSINKIENVAKSYDIKINVIDPLEEKALNLNPFIVQDKYKASSLVAKILSLVNTAKSINVDTVLFNLNSIQIIENLSLLLILTYPNSKHGLLPNYDDLYKLLNNFEYIAVLINELKKDKELAEKYSELIIYFENNFFGKDADILITKQAIKMPMIIINNILKDTNLKKLLCSRNHNINFEQAIAQCEFNLICLREDELINSNFNMPVVIKSLILELFKEIVPLNKNKIPHFLYIDDFTQVLAKNDEYNNSKIFKTFGKYNIGVTITLDNANDLGTFKNQCIQDIGSKIILGGEKEDLEIWEKHFGMYTEWSAIKTTQDETSIETMTNINEDEGKKESFANVKAGKMASLKFKNCAYKLEQKPGKYNVGIGSLNTIDSKHYLPFIIKNIDFSKWTDGDVDTDT